MQLDDNSTKKEDLAPAAQVMSTIYATSNNVGDASHEEAGTREGSPSLEEQLEIANKEWQSLREGIFSLEELLKSKSFDEDAFRNNDKVSEKS